ncbi:MAG: Rossmann-like domain-containing protein [bacterium]
MILDETIHILKNRYKNQVENLFISDVRIGLYMTAIRLSDGSTGLSSTAKPVNPEIHRKKENRDYGDFTPNNITGKKVTDLLGSSKEGPLVDTLRVAALNAISTEIISNSGFKVLRNTDPIDLVDLGQNKTITLVGAFQSYIQKISQTKNRLFVLELNEQALEEDDRRYFIPASEYGRVLTLSDIVIITGLTLVNHTLDQLLKTIPAEAEVIVTGPSSSIIPDILFQKNVGIIGAIRITDPELTLKIVSEGAAGYHMFQYCAEKICILNSVCP